ncbi:MAG TPA: ATP-binding protein [Puia sp.]|nr:ATP-binding protein [Puia sp.]
MNQHELDVILQEGECQKIEFKRSINSDLSRELTAFANSSGGKIFIGIEDSGTVYGIKITNELRSRIESMARDCDPPIPVELEASDNILIIHVPEGKDKPYRSANGFYIRSGASSVKLSTQEIIEFVKTEGKVKFEELHTPSVKYPDCLDASTINRYVRLSGISEVIGTNELLANLGVLYEDRVAPILNNAGILFFVKHPARIMPHGAVTCLLFKGNTKVHIIDRKSYEFDLITNIDESVAFLERHLNLAYEIKGIRRKEILEIPAFVLREAIINAVAHRDYFERGANVMVEIFDNRIEISNPGGLPKGLKPENFGKYSVARNSLVAGLLHRCHYIEKVGTGIQRMRDGMREANLPEPVFEFSEFFTVILCRYNIAKDLKEELGLNDKRTERIFSILQALVRQQSLFDVEELAAELLISSRTLRNDLALLVQHGWINSSGSTKGRNYSLTSLAKERLSRHL